MKEVLRHLTKITTLNAFEDITNTTVNLKDCFEECFTIEDGNKNYPLVSISRFIRTGSNWTNLTYTSDDGTTKKSCFSCLNNLKRVHTGFTTSSTKPNTNIDLFYLFTANQWKTLERIYPYTDVFPNIFSAKKTITEDDYVTLTSYIGSNSNLSETLSNTFKNCTITNCTNNPVLTLGLRNNSSITQLYHVFDTVKAVDTSNNTIRVRLDYDFFKYLKNLTHCIGLFRNNDFSNIIPFDFFKKRKMITGTGYVPRRSNSNGSWEYNSYDIYYYSPTENNSLNPPLQEEDEHQSNDGYGNWQKARSTNIKGSTTSDYRYLYGANYGSNQAILLETFNNPLLVNYRYFTYGDNDNQRTIKNASEMFENCTFEYPYFKFACYDSSNNMLSGDDLANAQQDWIAENTSYIKDDNGNEYDSFYSDSDCKNPYNNYRPSYEIDDLNIDSNDLYTEEQVTVLNRSLFNFKLVHKTRSESRFYPIVPTDFFYGLSDTCDIQSIFAYNKSGSYNNYDEIKLLEGYLPSHLFSLTTNLINCSNFIQELNVIPVKHENTNNYVFVPQKFINFVLSSIVNLFNFRIRVPGETTKGTKFYVMYSNSLNTGSRTAQFNTSGFLPRHTLHYSSGSSEGIIAGNTNNIRNVCEHNCNYNYYIMLEEDGESPGYLDDLSNNMIYDNLVSEDLLYVLSGSIWSGDFKMETFNNNTPGVATFDSVIKVNGNTYGINRNFMFPRADNSFTGYKTKVLGTSINQIHQESLNGCEELWRNAYNGLYIFTN